MTRRLRDGLLTVALEAEGRPALARVQELGGKPAAAVDTYQRLLKEIPDTRRSDDLKTHLANLKSRPGQ